MKTTKVRLLAATCIGVACASTGSNVPAHAVDHATLPSVTALSSQFDSLRRALRIPGLAVAVLRDTTVVLARGFGYANVERQVPVTPETPFNIASVSKPISAVVALRLAQDGRLNLDRPMRAYQGFSEFCDATREEGGVFFSDFACTDDRLTLRHVLSMSANGAVPGTRFWYNPPSYSWASRPMAEVTGRSFSELVDSLVFRPALMRNAARTNRRLPLPPQTVALSTDLLLTPASRGALWTGMRTPTGEQLPYGLGWFLGSLQGRRVAWHTGLWEGRYSALYLKVLGDAPAERLTLILLANSDGLQWPSELDEAAIERSPFATAFLAEMSKSR